MTSADVVAALVIASATEPESRDADAVARSMSGMADWDLLADTAIRQGVTGYVLRALRWFGGAPETVTATLRAAEVTSVARALSLDATLAELARGCTARGIQPMVIKGPVLARTLYPEPALRPYDDLDIVVHETDVTGAIEVIAALGFTEVAYAAEVARRPFAGAGGDEPFQRIFVDGSDRSMIELHVDPLQLGIVPRLEGERWRRALPVEDIAPGTVTLSREDALVQLCVHAHKHGFSRLVWLKDLDLFVRREGASLDWPLVARSARTEGVASSVWFGLALAGAVLGTPRTPAERLAPPLPVRRLYRWAWPVSRARSLGTRMRRRAVQFHAAESWRGMVPSILFMERRADRSRLMLRSILARAQRSTKAQPRANAAGTGLLPYS